MSLAAAYLAERDASGVAEHAETRLADLLRAVKAAHPELEVPEEAFAAAVARVEAPLEAIDASAALEVAVALGCARGDRAAIAVFEARWIAPVPGMIAHMKLAPAMVEDVVQETRRKLLVGPDGGAPPLVGYAGKGKLAGLVKVTAVRCAISLLRKAPKDHTSATSDIAGPADVELGFLQENYRAAFRQAFERAIAALDPRSKNLLRLHFLGRVTLESLAQMYGVHRATIVRQLSRARERLADSTRKELGAALRANSSEIESILDLVRSRFDVTVERLLRSEVESARSGAASAESESDEQPGLQPDDEPDDAEPDDAEPDDAST